MKFEILVILLLGAQFSLTAFAPAANGKAWFLWPFSDRSKSWLDSSGGLPKQGGVITTVLAGIAGLGFLAAALATFSLLVPASWFTTLVIISSIASAILFVLYVNVWAIAPLVVNAILLLDIFAAIGDRD